MVTVTDIDHFWVGAAVASAVIVIISWISGRFRDDGR